MKVQLLTLLGLCTLPVAPMVNAQDAHQLAMQGRKLSTEEVAELEKEVSENPDDLDSRTILLGYYFSNRPRKAAKEAKRKHVLWLVKNQPNSPTLATPYAEIHPAFDPDGYVEVKKCWLELAEVEPPNLIALKNAANFLLLNDRDIAEVLLLKGQKLDPEDPKWAKSLGHLYSLGMGRISDDEERKAMAEKVFQQYRIAFDASPPISQNAMLGDLAKAALLAGKIDDAKKYAQQMLNFDGPNNWNSGNLVHHGNLILGRIALSEGDDAKAKAHLLSAGRTTGSPQLNSFGPNMVLANEFLKKGESDVVLEYFQLCRKFWKSGGKNLDQWSDAVKDDRLPDFGGNMRY